jgi:hypothetical protein
MSESLGTAVVDTPARAANTEPGRCVQTPCLDQDIYIREIAQYSSRDAATRPVAYN